MRILALLPFVLATAAPAAERAEVERLWQLLEMDAVIAVMRDEGLDYGESLDTDMLDGRGGPGWAATVSGIYDAGRMRGTSLERFAQDLAAEDVTPMLAFFEAELGARLIDLELEARRALLDPEVEAAGKAKVEEMRAAADPRIDLLDRFVEANDLVENNVSGALNSSYAFFRGLAEGGALGDDMGEAEIVSDVWSQEPGVRADTMDWVYTFAALAYQPVSDADLAAYAEFSAGRPGQVLNRAIFVAFDQMFVDISHAMGLGVARFLVSEEL